MIFIIFPTVIYSNSFYLLSVVVDKKRHHNNVLPYVDSQLFNRIWNVLRTCSKILPRWWILRHDNEIFGGIYYTTRTVDKPSTCFDDWLLSLTCLYWNLCGYCDKLTRAGIDTQIVDSIYKQFSLCYLNRIIIKLFYLTKALSLQHIFFCFHLSSLHLVLWFLLPTQRWNWLQL